MDILANIKGIKYKPYLCRKLNSYDMNDLSKALSKEATFILNINKKDKIAVSWWVSAKRTRSYPYARVYDSLGFSGKKLTIIPIYKDEGKDGDRDFLQWDTVSLMSLLGVYVIIAYYDNARKNSTYKNKITEQRFNVKFIIDNIRNLLSYHSDSLHWNLSQIEKIGSIAKKAFKSYDKISKSNGVLMHSKKLAQRRIALLAKDKGAFMKSSRQLAKQAQRRESLTRQPKEKLDGTKATLTIKNYLGGYYCFTADEVDKEGSTVHLIEGKHTKGNKLPALEDIKEGLLKMVLFTNLEDVVIDSLIYTQMPILKLTSGSSFKMNKLNKSQKATLTSLKLESKKNRFKILINDKYVT
jgi:hypothetical protein